MEQITIENYEKKRCELVDLNSNLQGVILNEKEKTVDCYLAELKDDFVKSYNGLVPYDMPTLTDARIQQSKLYQFCDSMPKGADLHVHDMSLLPAHELINLLLTCPEFCINKDHKHYDLIIVEAGEEIKDGYMRFCDAIESSYYTREEICKNWTTEGFNDSGMNIWDYFEELFCRHAVFSDKISFVNKYYKYTFRYYCKHNIMHVEIHLMLVMDIDESNDYVKAIRDAYYDTKKEYPFFTCRIIGAGVKADNDNIETTKHCFLNTSYVQEVTKDESDPNNPKNFIIGFDLVNEEDASLPLKAFAPMLLKVKKQYPDMKLYIHGGESLSASNDNLIDAYLLGASRVGHGLNLYRYPDLHARYVQAEICLEVCPISNERLQYTIDLRNHLATEYLKSGIIMALCSDDPQYMEYQTLTDDFFAAIVCWDLKLADIKQFGINSIMYSGLDNETKALALKNYRLLWNVFIDEQLKLIDKGEIVLGEVLND